MTAVEERRTDAPAPEQEALACRAHSGTTCKAHTRAYRDGELVEEGFDVARVSDFLDDGKTVVWLDMLTPTAHDLSVLTEELGLHPLAVEDATSEHQRPKLDRYSDHLFLNTYVVRVDEKTGEITPEEVSAFITARAFVTVRKDDSLRVEPLIERWDSSRDNAASGVSYLLHGLLDLIVDGHFEAVQTLDDLSEQLEDLLFADGDHAVELQRQTFDMRKSLVTLRRVVLPMREVLNSIMRRDLHLVDESMSPYYQDVYDHVLRATEWTESLRDLVSTILETNLTIQGNTLNVVMRKLTSWAALLAVTTAVTGFYGQNVPYPGFGREWGFASSMALLVGISAALYVLLKKRGWL